MDAGFHLRAHDVGQEGGFLGVLRHQVQEAVHFTIESRLVFDDVPAHIPPAFLGAAHFAADFVALLFVDACQVSFKIAGQGDGWRGLVDFFGVNPAAFDGFLFQGQ